MESTRGLENQMVADRGASDLYHLHRANAGMLRYWWMFPPATPERLANFFYGCQS